MFKLIIVGGPAENYIEGCLQSVLSQKEEYKAAVVLDPVEDNTFEKARKFSNENIKIRLNDTRRWALPNIISCLEMLDPEDEDILVTLDADDWFSSSESLSIIKSYYDKYPETLVTYGSWQGYPDAACMTNCAPYTEEEFNRSLRFSPWKGTHTRTMKYKVWKNINDSDLRDDSGNYFRSAWDLSFMWPALEMAGYHRSKYIPEKTYVYNRETPHNDEKLRSNEQRGYHMYLQNKPPYLCKDIF